MIFLPERSFENLPYLDHGWLVWLVWLVYADCVPAVHRAALYTALVATLRAGSGRDFTSAAGPQQVTVYDPGTFFRNMPWVAMCQL